MNIQTSDTTSFSPDTVSTETYRCGEGEFIDLFENDTQAWLQTHYPAVTATKPVGMSSGYQFMNTLKFGQMLQKDFGLSLVSVGQQFSRSRDPLGQEHILRFRFKDGDDSTALDDSTPELIIMNSHNGRCCIRAMMGVFRFVCANGMVIGEGTMDKLRHFGEGNDHEEFSKVLKDLAKRMVMQTKRIKAMSAVMLSRHDQNQMAKMLMGQRKVPSWVTTKMVLEVHRQEDAAEPDGTRDMWKTFNVVQENLTSRSMTSEPTDGERASSTRPITGARSQVLTNEKLWIGLENFIATRRVKMPDFLKDVAKAVAAEKPLDAAKKAKEANKSQADGAKETQEA